MDGVRRCPKSSTGVYSVFEGPCTVCFYSVQHGRQFHWLLGLYTLHQTGIPCKPSSTLPYQPRHNVVSACPAAICYLTASTHYNSSALISECNGLSQFKEDTGEPFVPVREFNLVTCPARLIEL